MAGIVYKWRDGSRGFGVKAAIVGERIEQIRIANGGRIDPADVVNDARSKQSPLHKAFEWNDSKAAESYRVWQARSMLGALVVIHESANDLGPVRAFVNVRENVDASYTSIDDAMSVPDLRRQVISRALREAKEWRRRYNQYNELGAIFAAIDAIEQTVSV